MIALDTNILARFFIEDSQDKEAIKQQRLAHKIMLNDCYISLTVIMEFFWVMYKGYKLTKEQIHQVINKLCSFTHVTIEHRHHVLTALELFMQGMDFADALHLAQAAHCECFYTFDKKFANKASQFYPFIKVLQPA